MEFQIRVFRGESIFRRDENRSACLDLTTVVQVGLQDELCGLIRKRAPIDQITAIEMHDEIGNAVVVRIFDR